MAEITDKIRERIKNLILDLRSGATILDGWSPGKIQVDCKHCDPDVGFTCEVCNACGEMRSAASLFEYLINVKKPTVADVSLSDGFPIYPHMSEQIDKQDSSDDIKKDIDKEFIDTISRIVPYERDPAHLSYVCSRRGVAPDQIVEEEIIDTDEPVEAPVDKTVEYLQNSDSVWFKTDVGEYVKLYERTFQRCEDQWEPGDGIEYFQVATEKLDPDELERTNGAVEGDVKSICKVFIIGIKDADLTTEIKIADRPFYVQDSNGGDGDTWSVSFVAVD